MFADKECKPGEIRVFFGPMNSGKTEEFVRFLKRAAVHARFSFQAFKPDVDIRNDPNKICGKDGDEIPATTIHNAIEIWTHLDPKVDIVGIDEAQFFDEMIVPIVQELSCQGKRVVIAGLPTDFRGEPFGFMPQLIAIAHVLDKRETAICTYQEDGWDKPCGALATQTQRIIDGQVAKWDDPVIVVGDSEKYESRCRRHHFVPGKPSYEEIVKNLTSR